MQNASEDLSKVGLRFRRRFKIAPGVHINLGKSGISLSVGVRGASLTFGTGGVHANVGLPGTGLSYRTRISERRPMPTLAPPPVQAPPVAIPPPPPAPVQVKIRFVVKDDGTVSMFDAQDRQLPAKALTHVVKLNREKVHEWLSLAVAKFNSTNSAISEVHLDAPYPIYRKPDRPVFDEPPPSDPSRFSGWEARRIQFENVQKTVALNHEARLRSEPDYMAQVLERELNRLAWPRETSVAVEILEDARTIMLDVDLPEIEDLPRLTASVHPSCTRLRMRPKPPKQLRQEYARHVHGVGFRVAAVVFASLPLADRCVVSGYSQRLSSVTGSVADEYLYSFLIERELFATINFTDLTTVDPVKELSRFPNRRSMTKTGVFRPVQPYRV